MKMELAEVAKKVEAEFEFTAEDLKSSIKEFLREMGTNDATETVTKELILSQ
jgi:hypothetical protein